MTREVPASVVHVLWSGGIGGIERLVHDLAVEQTRRGMDVMVAFGQATGHFADVSRTSGVRVIDLGISSGYDLRPRRITAGAALIRHADVIHAHGFNLPLAAVMRRAGRPIVFTDHGSVTVGRRVRPAERLKRPLFRRWLRRETAGVAANSSYTAGWLCRRHGRDARDVAVVHNGVDFSDISLPATRRPGPTLVIASVGRLVAFKRIDRLLRAVALLDAELDLSVLIVGDGPLESDLQALAADLCVTRRVTFLGRRGDVGTVLEGVDVLAHPSEEEPFGLAIIEACARGALPVVFADGGGALEVIPPDGRVASNVDDLAAILSDLVGSSDLSLDARRERHRWARNSFSIARTADGYDALYRAGVTIDR